MKESEIETIGAPAALEMEAAIEEIAKRHGLDEESTLAAQLSIIAHQTDVDPNKRALVLTYLYATMQEIASHRVVGDSTFDADTSTPTPKITPS